MIIQKNVTKKLLESELNGFLLITFIPIGPI